MASPKALLEWCRATCAGYSNVDVKDWSSSFRNGLAFCAIIHKHRPELIDFSSLCKTDAHQNHKLASELAETELGISMWLVPKELQSAQDPDRLAVITSIAQLYFLFNKKAIDPVSLQSTCVDVFAWTAQSLTHLESPGAYPLSPAKPCYLCLKPVHLIQQRVVDGRICHRKCFKCKRCQLSLLPGTYAKGDSANSFLCLHHVKSRGGSPSSDSCGYLSLSGLTISRVPHYPTKTELPDGPVCTQSEMRPTVTRRSSSGENTPAPGHMDNKTGCCDEEQEVGTLEDSENTLGKDGERGGRPVPAPRRRGISSGATSPLNTSSSATRGTSVQTSASAPVAAPLGSSSSKGSSRVQTNHPWLKIIHPGPWTQLPPAPAPVHPLRAKSVSSLSGVWCRPSPRATNPFEEEPEETAGGTRLTGNVSERYSGCASESDVKVDEVIDLDQSEDARPCAGDLEEQTSTVFTNEALSRSDSSSVDSPLSTKKAPDERAAPESTRRPSHGFPLVRRKVQTDLSTSPEDLQEQMGRVSRHLQALEERGVLLETTIRSCLNKKEEEKLLLVWLSLVHQRHVLVRKEAELVYLIKQQELEQRQEDVEFEFRRLLNKPEGEWTKQDRQQDQQLMQELLGIIEQRNQIISSLDQDVQRERAEDVDWETTVKNKEVQRRELKDLKKSKGKFKTASVFKIMNKKPES